ncbi:MAG: mandelate racemase/muconate lactonizing enzyme family protein [Cyclobacteriaceae bacterium]
MTPISRKSFLKSSLLAAAGMGLTTTKHIAADQKVAAEIKITDVKPYVMQRAIFVKVETDAGINGWGEASHNNPKLSAEVINSYLKKLVIGKSPFTTESFWTTMYFKEEDLGTSGLLPGTIAGIDNALWDLKGKILNLPVHKIMGSNGAERIRVYGSFKRGSGNNPKTPAQMAREAAAFVSQGYKTVKARMQIRALNINPEPDPTYAIVKEIRNAIGDDIELFVDFNNGYTAAKAIALTNKLYEHFNIAAVEEPVSYQDYNGLRQVVEAVDIPVMAGEHEFNKWQMRDLITIGKADMINLDVNKGGGLTEARKIAFMAEAFEKHIMVHNARPTLATAASLQLLSSISNAARVQEYAGKREELGLTPLFEDYFEFDNGYLRIPELPGLGLIVNEKAMEKNKLNK